METTSECQPHQLQMLDYVQKMLESEMFADVTICCQGRRLKAHRVLLSASSSYLQKLLLGHTTVDHVTLILGDVHHEDMAAILLLVYTGQVSVAKQRFETFMTVAELLDIHILNPIRDRATGYPKRINRFELGTAEEVAHKRWNEDEKKYLKRLSIEEEYKYKLMKLDQENASYKDCLNYVERVQKFTRENVKLSQESGVGDRMEVEGNEEEKVAGVMERRKLEEGRSMGGKTVNVRRGSTSNASVGGTDKAKDISVTEILSNLPGMTISKVSLGPSSVCSTKKQRSNSVSNEVNPKTVYNKNDENRCVNPRAKPLPSLMPITNGQLGPAGVKRQQNITRTPETGVIYNENGLTVREGFLNRNNYAANKNTKDNFVGNVNVEMLERWSNQNLPRLPPNLQSIAQAHCELERNKMANAKRWRSEDIVVEGEMESRKQGRYSRSSEDGSGRPRYLSLRENGEVRQDGVNSGRKLTPKEVLLVNKDYWRLDDRTGRPKLLTEGIANDLTQMKSPNSNGFITSTREERKEQEYLYRSFLEKHSQSRDHREDDDIQILDSFQRPFMEELLNKQQVVRRENSYSGHEYLRDKLRKTPQYLNNEQGGLVARQGENNPLATKVDGEGSLSTFPPRMSQVPDIRVLEKTTNGFIQQVAHSLQGQMTSRETLYPGKKSPEVNLQNGTLYQQGHKHNNVKHPENYILNRTLGGSHINLEDLSKIKQATKIVNSKEPIPQQGQKVITSVYNLNDPNLNCYRHQENAINKQEPGITNCVTTVINPNQLPLDRRTLTFEESKQFAVNRNLDSNKRLQRDVVIGSNVVRTSANMTKPNGTKLIVIGGETNRLTEMMKQSVPVSAENDGSFVLKRFQAGGASLEHDRGSDCNTPILKRGLLSPNACRMTPAPTKTGVRSPDGEDSNSTTRTQASPRNTSVIIKNNEEIDAVHKHQQLKNGFPHHKPEFALLKQKLQPNHHEIKTSPPPNMAILDCDPNVTIKRGPASEPVGPMSVSSFRSTEMDSPLLKISLQKHSNIERIMTTTFPPAEIFKTVDNRKAPESNILEMTIIKKPTGVKSPINQSTEVHVSNDSRASQDGVGSIPGGAAQSVEVKPPREVRKDFTCFDCGKPFTHPDLLLDHQMTHDGIQPYRCDTCGGEFTDKGHWTTDHNQPLPNKGETFSCQHCHKTFLTRGSLKVHVRTHTGIKPYQCGDCGKQFSQLRNFKYHQSIHAGTKEFSTTCPECGKYFNDRGYLSSHMKIHLNKKEYECQFCDKRFNQRVAYNMHVRIHTGLKPHSCPSCSKCFSRKMLLKQHLRIHTGERPFSCDVCGKAFADRSNMSLHMRLHSGIKPYSCAVCSKSFTKKHHLKTHMNFHLGIRPYSCVKCNLTFSQSSNMRTHSKRCLGTGGEGGDSVEVEKMVDDVAKESGTSIEKT